MNARREYIVTMHKRYLQARTRKERSIILNELVQVAGYHRKYAIRLMNQAAVSRPAKPKKPRPKRYLECLPVVALVWEALDYCCAERLHPQLLRVAEQLHRHGALHLTDEIREQLASISRATLARRLSSMPRPTPRKIVKASRPGRLLQTQIPIERYAWDESRPGALEVDLVEHNGGSTTGHYAYTLSVVDVVSGWSRRRAMLGKSQRAVHGALSDILGQWPVAVWGLHSDNGSEFLNGQLALFAKDRGIRFSRSKPYHKNDNAHVEQKNRQFVRDIVGYDRYDTQEAVDWLNRVYDILDPYANLVLPALKVTAKTREGSRVRKRYDIARTPLQRLIRCGGLDAATQARLEAEAANLNPLAMRRQLEALIMQGPPTSSGTPWADTPTGELVLV